MKQFLYEHIYQDLLSKIERGEYAHGDFLPPENQLCLDYDVSIITVRKALEQLKEAGLISKVKGKGSLVTAKIRSSILNSKSIAVLDIPFPFQMQSNYPEKEFPQAIFCDKNNWSHLLYSSLYHHVPKDYNVILASYNYNVILNAYESTIIQGIERIMILGYYDKRLVDFLHEKGKLVLVYNCFDKNIDVCSVGSNTRKAFYEMTDYLYSLGHIHIAAVNGNISMSDNMERAMGYQERIITSGNRIETNYIKWGNMTFESGYYLANEVLDSNPEVTAFVCVNDNVALGVLHAVQERGLRCPEDVSIVGHDDNIFVNEIVPDFLTTINSHLDKVGEKIAEQLVRPVWIDDQSSISYDLIFRKSVAPPRL